MLSPQLLLLTYSSGAKNFLNSSFFRLILYFLKKGMSEPSGMAQDLRYTKTLLPARSQSGASPFFGMCRVGVSQVHWVNPLQKDSFHKNLWVKISSRIIASKSFWLIRSKQPRNVDQWQFYHLTQFPNSLVSLAVLFPFGKLLIVPSH